MRFTFPRQRKEPWLCIADFFRPADSGDEDFASFMLCTIGARASEEAARLFAENHYQEYLFLHGLSVEMAEATAEYWHRRDPRGARLRRRGRPDPDRPLPPAVPGRPLLLGLPGLPRPDRQRQGRGAAGRGPHRRDGERGLPAATPSRRPTPSSATTPRPSTSSREDDAGPGPAAASPVPWRPAALLVVCWRGRAAAAVLPAASCRRGRRASLGTVVIPNLGPGYTVRSQGPLDPASSPPTRRIPRPPQGRCPRWPRPSPPTSGCGRPTAAATRCRTCWSASRTRRGPRCSCRPPSTRSSRARS